MRFVASATTCLVLILSACGGTVVFEEPGEGGRSGDGGNDSTSLSASRASSVVSSTNVGPSSSNASTGSGGCPDFVPYVCDGGTTCYGDASYCDSVPDCADGSDEFDCSPLCGGDEFTCFDGLCIPTDYLCDGFADCGAGEDETQELCGGIACGFDELPCFDGLCIPEDFICDGEADCAQGEDEDVEVCQTEVCGIDNLVTDDPASAYCISYYCCDELDFCMSQGEEACFNCLGEGGGELCDALYACLFDNCEL